MTRLILRLASLPATPPLSADAGRAPDAARTTSESTALSPNGHSSTVTTVMATSGNGDGGASGYGEPAQSQVIELSRHEREQAATDSTPSPAGPTDRTFPADQMRPDQLDTESLNGWMTATVGSTDSGLVVDDRGRIAAMSEPAARLLDCGPDVIGQLLTDAINVVDLDTGASVPVYSPGIPALDVLVTGGIRRSLMRVRRYDDALASLDVCSVAIHGVDGAVVGSMTFLEPVSG